MSVVRVAGAVLVTVGLVVGGGVAATAADGGVCTVTLQLPAVAQPGQPFTMAVVESPSCASVTGLQPFTGGGLIDSRSVTWDTGIHFTHTPGTGNFSYEGVAPGPGYYKNWLQWPEWNGSDPGYEVAFTTMTSTWASQDPAPTPTATPSPSASAPPAAKPAPLKRYTSCSVVHRDFTGGIAKAGVTKNTVKRAHHKTAHLKLRGHVKYSTALYSANRKLDTDSDGIVCEK